MLQDQNGRGPATKFVAVSAFTTGQQVRAAMNHGWRITEGRLYEVVETIPRLVTPTFTFPEYVVVLDDNGKPCTCYTYRFKAVE